MIVSFKDKYTSRVWNGEKTNKWSLEIQQIALRKLFLIHAAGDINDLKIPPGNKLHKLKGDMDNYWAIRINDQWRIIFNWIDNNAHNVQIIDYH